MTTTNTISTPSPLRFYLAVAAKRICLDNGFVEPDTQMFVAKWSGLYVVAKDNDNFFLVTEAQAPDYVRTERDDKNKLKPALAGPTITPVGEKFEWVVECGTSCADGCDEAIAITRTVATKEAAEALVAELDGTRVRGSRDFLRIRGPAFYQIKRPTPRPAPVVAPRQTSRARAVIPSVSSTYAPVMTRPISTVTGYPLENYLIANPRNPYIRYSDADWEIEPSEGYYDRTAMARVSEELLRRVNSFQQATVRASAVPVAPPVSVPESTTPSRPNNN